MRYTEKINGPSKALIGTAVSGDLQDERFDRFPLPIAKWNQDVSMAFTVDVLNKILEGKVPFGYGQREAVEPLVLPSPLTAVPISAFEGPFEIISVYRITNSGSEPVVLSPDALKKENGSWAFLNVHELCQDEQAICLVGRSKDESVS